LFLRELIIQTLRHDRELTWPGINNVTPLKPNLGTRTSAKNNFFGRIFLKYAAGSG
jgi:hypothetical protein